MIQLARVIASLCFAALLLMGSAAHAARLTGLSVNAAGTTSTVRFALDTVPEFHYFSLDDPARAVIDLEGTDIGSVAPVGRKPGLTGVRLARHGDGSTRVVIDLADGGTLQGVEARGNTLVATINTKASASVARVPASRAPRKDTGAQSAVRQDKEPEALYKAARVNGPVVVVIDPGHGGHDSGTRGANGLMEKTVALSIAKKLYAKLKATASVRPVLTRSDDHFVGLAERVRIAQNNHANLFVSIHQNAYPDDHRVDGGTCYVLSQHGATDAKAAQLAQFENSADRRVAGVDFSDTDPTLNAVLTDLYQNASIDDADSLADDIIGQFGRVGPIYRRTPPRANFAVLRDPMIPSVLCETAFLSNPAQARRLENDGFRDQLATAMFNGIMAYFEKHPPERMAPTGGSLYTVRAGDTLSEIAQRQGVSVDALMSINHLHSRNLSAGQKLELPHGR
ncbi:N-acetylmuramoyl-L-alanine amidase [uncultured Salinisphaera sp.]|uniref:N-acetylmuramoyl-L-alanine amidase n=1 Tax=uncultured Salinisphaera sp. TaxID=359372 RepID=UPI0032B27130